MTIAARASVASSFTVVKGSMIEETYAVFSAWDFTRSKRDNLQRLRQENYIGARSATWLRDIAHVLNRRFDPAGRDRPLVMLAQRGIPLHEWKPLLLWHMTRDEFLVRDFLQTWLFDQYQAGTFQLRTPDLFPYLARLSDFGATILHPWSQRTTRRVAAGLLKLATDFGLLRGSSNRTFVSYSLPERSFLYLLHAQRDFQVSPGKILSAPEWRLFLMRPQT